MAKYRISKYSPNYRNGEGIYTIDDWTSYSDIGKKYGGEKFTIEKYYEVEKNYGIIVEAILQDNGIEEVVVEELELNFTVHELKYLLGIKGLLLSNDNIKLIDNLKNGSIIPRNALKEVISLILRECFWCKLVSENHQFLIEFGYDLYVYVTCDILSDEMIQKAEKIGIYIENL